MSDYVPDRWVILEMTVGLRTTHKVFGGWYGGYTTGDSWRMNSGIKEIIDNGDCYDIIGYSGSVYKCEKVHEGMSAYMSGLLSNWNEQAKKEGLAEIKVINMKDYYNE